jgi:CheY-like chemotaxis protein/anti-sigma regulatory factor (Ser/Thr protein kinase)
METLSLVFMNSLRLLHVENSLLDAKMIAQNLAREGIDVYIERVESGEEMLAALVDKQWDIVIADYNFPNFSGLEALSILKATGIDIPFIIVSGTIGEDLAVEAMRLGAQDYVMKDNLSRLAPAITRELIDAGGRRDKRRAEQQHERAQTENVSLLRELANVTLWQRTFLSEILYTVTEGKLKLCDGAEDVPPIDGTCGGPLVLVRETMSEIRTIASEAAKSVGIADERCMDLMMAVGEAAMNAVVHGNGGTASICANESCVQVHIVDHGKGMDLTTLHRATLEAGYTTEGSLGMGFYIILHGIDRVYLYTSSSGTTVVLEQNVVAPEPAWLR